MVYLVFTGSSYCEGKPMDSYVGTAISIEDALRKVIANNGDWYQIVNHETMELIEDNKQ